MTLVVKDGIVTDNGAPAVKIYVGAEEKIGLPNYSNVVVSASLSRYVPEGSAEELKTALRESARIVEEFVAEERQSVLKDIQGT